MVQSFAPNMAPSEAQMRLAIGQILSMPFAYNAPVIVLDFDPGTLENEKITGRFKDLTRSRVFSFEINRKSVVYKPFTPRIDSRGVDLKNWEDFSAGYSYRIDAGGAKREKAQCVKPTSYNCGSICINIKKSCRANAQDDFSQERLFKLNELRAKYLRRSIKPGVLPEEEKEFLKKADELKKITEPLLIKEWEEVQRKREEYEVKKSEKQKQVMLEEQERLKKANEVDEKFRTISEQLRIKADQIRAKWEKERKEKEAKDAELDILLEQRKGRRDALMIEAQGKRAQLLKLQEDLNNSPPVPRFLPKKVIAQFLTNENIEYYTGAKTNERIKAILQEARKLIYVDNPTKINTNNTVLDKKRKKEYQDGIEELSRMIEIPGLTSTLSIREIKQGQRSCCWPTGTIDMGTTEKATLIHEAGHWIEDRSPLIHKEVLNFYNRRTAREETVKLKDVHPLNYEDYEVTKVDKWIHPYMGKVYGSNMYNTEVLSMGLELMHRNPIYLAKNDPEMFDFIYSVVRQGN